MKVCTLALVMAVLLCEHGGLGFMMYSHFCPAGESDVLDCIDTFLDANHDGTLTVSEIGDGLAALVNVTEIASQINASMVINGCDFNGDGVLTMDDWNAPVRISNSTCLSSGAWCGVFCYICSQNGWSPPAKKKKKTIPLVDVVAEKGAHDNDDPNTQENEMVYDQTVPHSSSSSSSNEMEEPSEDEK